MQREVFNLYQIHITFSANTTGCPNNYERQCILGDSGTFDELFLFSILVSFNVVQM